MNAQINLGNNHIINVDLSQPISISIPIKEGEENPNCYWADPVKFETIKAGNFIGSVADGGPVNYQKLHLTPHGNGTHTEGFGHITDSGATINNQLKSYHFYSKLISLTPQETTNGDLVIKLTSALEKADYSQVKALVIRTLPNTDSKLRKKYSGKNPPYIDHKLIDFWVSKGIEHLLIDLPSIDKEVDGGELLSHRAFWKSSSNERKNCTITELIFVPNTVPDECYLLNFQIINLAMDATPSNPILYKIKKHNYL